MIYNWLAAKEVKIQIDSIRKAEALKIREEQIERKEIKVELKKSKLNQSIVEVSQLKVQLYAELQLLNQRVLLAKLIESLRKDFGSIEPGIQIIDDEKYMTKYREHEATYALAVELAKNLDVYSEYKEFFKQREGIWNMVTRKL